MTPTVGPDTDQDGVPTPGVGARGTVSARSAADTRERALAGERVLSWLADVIAGRARPLGRVDDAFAGFIHGAQLDALAAAHGAVHPSFVKGQKGAFASAAGVERASADIVRHLGEAGVPSVTLKGPALGARYWGDASLRSSSDVDILVAPHHERAAREALARAGFVPTARYPDWYLRRLHYHVELRREQPRLTAELHWNVARPAVGRLPVERMIATAVRVPCDRCTLPALRPRWQLVTGAVHAIQHKLGLRALVDLSFVARSLTPEEWEEAVAEAEAAGLGPLVYYAVAVAAGRLRWQAPASIERLRPGPARDAAVRAFLSRLPRLAGFSLTQDRIWRVMMPLLAGSGWRWLRMLPLTLADRPRLIRWAEERRRRA